MSSDLEILNEWPDWFPLDKVQELEDIAAIGYSHDKIAMYFDVPVDEFLHEVQRPGSRILYHINRGILVNEASEAIATQQAANTGNATQAQRLDKRRYQVWFQQLKERIVYGKE